MLTFLRRADWALMGCAVFLTAASVGVIASVNPHEAVPQAIAFGIGFACMAMMALVDWRPLVARRSAAFSIYASGVALLVATYFFAPTIRSTRAWLVLGHTQFQTSEFMKFGLIVLFSYYFARRHEDIAQWKNILIPFAYAAVPVGLILLQPDMGSALIVLGIWAAYLFLGGIKWRHIAVGALAAATVGILGWNYLAGYQRERVRGLLDPRYDPLGVNYNVIQSKIAIGSGGILGKGWGQGTQVQLGFLPEAGNDFIFSAIAEEWGFLGIFTLLAAYCALIWRVLAVGARAESNFGRLICLGTCVLLLLHMGLNIGSAVGFVPVVGVPLPLMSYGGSNILTFFLLLGIVQSIAIRSAF